MANELGYQNAENAIMLLVDLYKQGKEAGIGGFQPIEAFKFIDELARVPDVYNNFKQTVAELKDSSFEERSALEKKVAASLNETPERARNIVTKGIDAIIGIVVFIDTIMSPNDTK